MFFSKASICDWRLFSLFFCLSCSSLTSLASFSCRSRLRWYQNKKSK
jgi:hypothetical protein